MGVLDGVKVLDLSRVLAGPLTGMWLGDLGADVIKVEQPDGDETRRWQPPAKDGRATYYLSANRNKRSVALDLTDDDDLAVAHRLAERADVVLENFRAGTLARFKLGEDAVRRRNPAVIYCSISGYGHGAGAHRPGYDFLAQAEGGLMSITGPDAETPTKVGVAISDVLTGLHATIGVLAALRHRDATGVGQHIELDLLHSTLASLVNQASGWLDGGVLPEARGNVHPSIAPYQTLATATGPLAVAVGSNRQFTALCTAIDRDDLATDPRFTQNADRVRHRPELEAELETTLATRPAEEWQPLLAQHGVPCGGVNDLAQAFALADELGLDPTVVLPLADGTTTTQITNPMSLSATPPSYRRAPPDLDEHGEQIRRGEVW